MPQKGEKPASHSLCVSGVCKFFSLLILFPLAYRWLIESSVHPVNLDVLGFFPSCVFQFTRNFSFVLAFLVLLFSIIRFLSKSICNAKFFFPIWPPLDLRASPTSLSYSLCQHLRKNSVFLTTQTCTQVNFPWQSRPLFLLLPLHHLFALFLSSYGNTVLYVNFLNKTTLSDSSGCRIFCRLKPLEVALQWLSQSPRKKKRLVNEWFIWKDKYSQPLPSNGVFISAGNKLLWDNSRPPGWMVPMCMSACVWWACGSSWLMIVWDTVGMIPSMVKYAPLDESHNAFFHHVLVEGKVVFTLKFKAIK